MKWNRLFRKERQGCIFLVTGTFVLVLLCSIITFVSSENAKPYEQLTYPEEFPTTYQEYYTLASEMAKAWDSDAQLVSANGMISCEQRISSSRGMTFQFAVSKFYFGLPRVAFARVEIRPDGKSARIVAELFDITGRPATINPQVMPVSLDEAIDIAEANGASGYMEEYPNCFIGFFLYVDYLWNLHFIPDTTSNSDVKFRIDSRTGEIREQNID